MSKEQAFATQCQCGLMVTFVEQHLQHCKGGTVTTETKQRKRRRKKKS